MPGAASQGIAVSRALDAVMRNDRGRLLAALIARLRDFQLAEEALQEAAASALVHWSRSGLPASPQGWLLRVALRKAIDRLRAAVREGRKAADLAPLLAPEAQDAQGDDFPDDRLRLIFTCCHPALEPKSRVALTLRTLGGLSTAQIAAVFLDAEPTMGQRLSRARARIAASGIPYRVPGPEDWAERLQSVLNVIYLIFTTGYACPADAPGGVTDLCAEAIFLARMMDILRPGEAEIEGLLALMLLTHARCAARRNATGATVALALQDRGLWNDAMIAEGAAVLDAAMARGTPGPCQIKAAVAALHVAPGPTDWPQIALLYDSLLRIEATPVVRLNRAVALAEAGELAAGLREFEALAATLDGYQPLHAARAEYLARAGLREDAVAAYARAIALAPTAADAAFLRDRRDCGNT